jgi:molybdopterin adenylyltransferase
VRVAILTVSDRCARGEAEDLTGDGLRRALEARGAQVVASALVPDDRDSIQAQLVHFCDNLGVDMVFTNGGTGLGPRDVTPEATEAVLERRAPGIAEAIRAGGLPKAPTAMLSRGTAGLRRGTLVVNLPGSPRGHAVDMIAGRGH